MHERRCNKAPPVVSQGGWSEVASPGEHLIGRWLEHRGAVGDHQEKDDHARTGESPRDDRTLNSPCCSGVYRRRLAPGAARTDRWEIARAVPEPPTALHAPGHTNLGGPSRIALSGRQMNLVIGGLSTPEDSTTDESGSGHVGDRRSHAP